MWIWVIPLVLVGVAFVLRSSISKKNKVRPFASSGVGGFIESILGSAGVVVVVGVVAVGALFVFFVVAGIADMVTGGKVQDTIDTSVAVVRGEPLPRRPSMDCDFEEKLKARRHTLSAEWISATICKNDRQFKFFVPSGKMPEVQYRDKTDVVLSSRHISEFVEIEPTWGKPGGTPNLYRMYVTPGNNGFAKASVDSVTLAIRAR